MSASRNSPSDPPVEEEIEQRAGDHSTQIGKVMGDLRISYAVPAILVIAVLLIAIVLVSGVNVPVLLGLMSPSATSTSGQITVADQVEKCMQQHHLSKAQAAATVPPEPTQAYQGFTTWQTTQFSQCVWPPQSYSDPDGYSEIRVEMVDGPGPDEASGATLVDRIFAPCDKVSLSYSYGKMGDSEHYPPFDVTKDSIVTAWDGKPWQGVGGNDLGFYPDRGEIDVVHNGSYVLDAAVCVP